ncbi:MULTISPECIES: hypothetical protein [Stenotrophomonas maltophilia group]|nr:MULTISPECIES: hypothetical protein [Stenotrophomonas maltophilia group]
MELRTYGTARVYLHRPDAYHEPLVRTEATPEDAAAYVERMNRSLKAARP